MGTRQISIVRDLDPDRIARLRSDGEFFWADLDLEGPGAIDGIARRFELPAEATAALSALDDGGPPGRRLHVADEVVVFPFVCATNPEAPPDDPDASLGLRRVNVLVHGDFLLTLHRDPIDLPALATPDGIRGDRSEHYIVYSVLDGMISTMLEALAAIENQISEVEDMLGESGWRQRASDQRMVKTQRSRLTELRVRLGPGPGVFERIAEEIAQVPGLQGDRFPYFERIEGQLTRTVDRIDAASRTLSNAVQGQLNETTNRLTVVATIFLPLTFAAGFFGMNFGWMVDEISSATTFWLLGVGLVIVAPLAVFALLVRPKRS